MVSSVALPPQRLAARPVQRHRPGRQQGPGDLAAATRILLPYLAMVLLLLQFKATLLRPLFPLATLAVGYLIYRRNESYFISFLLWVYMLTPLLRRLIDWHSSYEDQSAVLLAPLLLTLLPIINLRRRLVVASPVLRRAAILALGAVAFGTGVGLIKHPKVSVILAALTWTAPIILCVFAATLREREQLPTVLKTTFTYSLIALSVYGIAQFVLAPAWDVYWLKEVSASSIAPSFGLPHPFQMRVWSTMNSPGAFAPFLSAAILWIISAEGFTPLLAQVFGYIALLLTLVRGLWIQTAIGVVLLLLVSRLRTRFRVLMSVVLLILALLLAVRTVPHADVITRRLQSFTSLHGDESYNERRELYRYVEGVILVSPMGNGLDTTNDVHGYPLDSSVLSLLYLLGWPGAGLYFAALGSLLFTIARDTFQTRSMTDMARFRTASGVVALAASTQMVSGDIVSRQGGVVLWLAFGLWSLAAYAPARSMKNRRTGFVSRDPGPRREVSA